MNLFAAALVAASAFFGAEETPGNVKKPAPAVRYGETVALGKGILRSFVRLDAQGNPAQVGVAVSEAALNSLPAEDKFLVVHMPAGSEKTLIQHVSFNWMPHGHEPDGVYNVPHFDCHFYMTSNEERMGIVADDPRFAKNPEPEYVPQGFVRVHPLPQMGVHWVDPTSTEFQGKPFTTTFIYGSLDGRVTFLEPMFTLDFLRKVKDERLPVKQPQKVARSGYYPTEYRYVYNAAEKQYEIILDKLQNRP